MKTSIFKSFKKKRLFCPVEAQRISWMVSQNERTNQNFYQNNPAPQLMVPHKLVTNVKPHEKSRSSEGRGACTQQEQINIDTGIVNIGSATSRKGLEKENQKKKIEGGKKGIKGA